MKKCPYCKADIEENARFCFYCMTSLEEKETVATPVLKKKYWAVGIAALFVVALAVGGLFWAFGKKEPEQPPVSDDQSVAGENLADGAEGEPDAGESPTGGTEGEPDAEEKPTGGAESQPDEKPRQEKPGDDDEEEPDAGQPESSPTDSESEQSGNTPTVESPEQPVTSPDHTSGNSNSNTSGNTNSSTSSGNTNSSTSNNTNGSTTTDSQQTTPPTQSEEMPETTVPDDTEESAPENSGGAESAPVTEATYEYRAARNGDDYYVYADLENCVVITGVKTPASDGVYRVPSTLDGKKVLAVVSLAFSDEAIRDTVKTVYLPASVRTVHDHAFAACRNLTDIYLEGNSIYVSSFAFADKEERSGTLTIHSSYNCSNRDFRYYRNIAGSFYDAEWSEI